jgi:G3E family GTPase
MLFASATPLTRLHRHRSDFVAGLETLVKRKKFDYIFLECSGLADPGALAGMFWQDAELEAPVSLDAIVALVDAKHFRQHADAAHSAHAAQVVRQIAFADRIIVNKRDLVGAAEMDELQTLLRRVNLVAPIHAAERSVIDLSLILHTHAFEINSSGAEIESLIVARGGSVAAAAAAAAQPSHQCLSASCSDPSHQASAAAPPAASNADATAASASACLHDDTIRTVVLERREAGVRVDLALFRQFLADLLWEPVEHGYSESQEIFRMKAVLSATDAGGDGDSSDEESDDGGDESDGDDGSDSDDDGDGNDAAKPPARFFLQAVQQLFEIQRGVAWPSGEAPFTRLVTIGRRIDEARLRVAFENTFVRTAAGAAASLP